MLMHRRTQGQPITLYYRKSIEHRPRMVPKEQYAQAWEAEAKRIQGLFELEQAKCKALADELEEVQERLNLTESMLHSAAKDNMSKDIQIKMLSKNKGACNGD